MRLSDITGILQSVTSLFCGAPSPKKNPRSAPVLRQQILLKLLKRALHLIGGKSLGVVYSEITNLVHMGERVGAQDSVIPTFVKL